MAGWETLGRQEAQLRLIESGELFSVHACLGGFLFLTFLLLKSTLHTPVCKSQRKLQL